MNEKLQNLYEQQMEMIANPLMIKQAQLAAKDKQKIANDYVQLRKNLVMQHMLRNEKQGAAIYKSMEQIKSFIKGLPQESPVKTYMKQLFASDKVKQAEYMMNPVVMDCSLECQQEQKGEFMKFATKAINKSVAEIQTISKQFNKDVSKTKIINMNVNQQLLLLTQKIREKERLD